MNIRDRSVWIARLIRPRLIDRPLWRWRHRRGLPPLDEQLGRRLLPYGGSGDWLTRFGRAHAAAFGIGPDARDDYLAARGTLALDPAPPIARADLTAARVFDVLGSGPITLSTPIDWDLDFKSGLRFGRGIAWRIDYRDAGRASDVKVPWEIARFHSGVWLGQAYWLTGDERYSTSFAALCREWLDANPPGEGIHWACPMELAIRAVNWSMAFGYFRGSPVIDPILWARMLASLVWHGRVIAHNLEYGRRVGNHFVADAMGLFCLGALFREGAEGRRWLLRGHEMLEQQMRWQVFPDGVHYEQSVSYHRLVAEMFAVAFSIGRRLGNGFSAEFARRFGAMCEYTAAYTRPDGSTPLCSDADDGRILPFGAGNRVTDHRHLLATGGALLGRPDLWSAADGHTEDALWLAGPTGLPSGPVASHPRRQPCIFRRAGIAIIADEDFHAFLDAAPLGIEGDLVHGHLDALSLELYGPGGLFISDSGCFAYTSDPEAYREFTSTRAHNVPILDGLDQATLTGMWRIDRDGTNCRVLRWVAKQKGGWVWEAEHHGYARLADPVTHRREVKFDPVGREWIITDRLAGSAVHEVEWHWHAAIGVSVQREKSCRWLLERPGGRVVVSTTVPLELGEGWVAPSYGVRVRCPVLSGRVRTALPLTITTRFRWITATAP